MCDGAQVQRKFLKKDILFSFSFGDRAYCVLKTENHSEYECVSVRWRPIRGWHHDRCLVDKKALYVANRICTLAEKYADRFALQGEHYTVSCEDAQDASRLRIRKERRPLLSGYRATVPMLLQFLLAMASVGIMYVLFRDVGLEWLTFILPKADPNASKYCFALVEFGIPALLFFLLPGKRSFVSAYFHAIVPIGVVLFAGVVKRWTWIVFLLPIVLPAVYAMVIAYRAFLQLDAKTDTRIQRTFEEWRGVAILLCVVCILCVANLNVSPYECKSQPKTELSAVEQEVCAQYELACEQLEDGHFQSLNTEQKLGVLQRICDYECVITFGCESVQLYVLDIENEKTDGYYNPKQQSITIDIDHLDEDTTYEVVSTLLHEVRHHWQWNMANAYASVAPFLNREQMELHPFREACAYYENFKDYHEAENGYEAYYSQSLEQDARDWSDDRIYWYATYIFDW